MTATEPRPEMSAPRGSVKNGVPPTSGAAGRPVSELSGRPGPKSPPGAEAGAGIEIGRRIAGLVISAAIAGTAGYGFHRVFALRDLAPVLAASVAVPVVLAALTSLRRRPWPLWTSIALTLAGWLAITILVTFHGHADLKAVGNGLRDSWKDILTTILPAPGTSGLLILPATATWLAAFAGAELTLRTRTRAIPAVPAILLFGLALLFGVDGPGSNLPVAAVLTGLVVTFMLIRADAGADTGADTGERGILGSLGWVPVAAALAALGFAVAPYLPKAATPYDPRSKVQAPPPQSRDSVSPLDRVSAWLQSPDQEMFTVRSASPQNWRLAVLDHFDGATWTNGATFVPAGSRVPGGNGTAHTARVDQNVTIKNLPGVWMPAADRPRSVKGLGVIVDPQSGVITAVRPLRTGEAYQVTSATRAYSADELASAVPATDARARAALGVPVTSTPKGRPTGPEWFRRLAQQVVAGQSSPFQDAAKLAQWLSTHAKYDVTALPGHGYDQLEFFLQTSKRGTSEQFATAFAIMARTIGLPTRVVVGFRPGTNDSGTWQVDSGDVLVWPEVDFAGLGWVPFFPTPEQAGRSSKSNSVPAGETQQKIESAQKNAASHTKGQGKGRTPDVPPVHPKPPPSHHHHTPWWVFAAIAAGCLPVLYVIGALIIPLLRRGRRRRLDDPAARIGGAWQDTLDQLRDVGLSSSQALTAHEVADAAIGRVGGERPLRSLADLVNHAEYAASAPQAAAADAAWAHADEVGRLVTRTVGRPRRLLRRLHPRSLSLGRRGSPRSR